MNEQSIPVTHLSSNQAAIQLKTSGTRVYTGLSALVFLILVVYAIRHTWEYDEAWTYLSVKNESFWDLVTYKNFNIANNHLLNSLWFKALQLAGLKHIVFYRCASLLSFIFYAFFLYKAVTYKAPFWKTGHDWYLALFFLPPVIFFFASGRGYSMAVASFCASLYYLKVYLSEKKAAAYWKFFFWGALSSLSIVSFFFPFVAMLLYCLAKTYRDRLFSLQNIVSAVLLGGLALYIYHIGKTIILHDTIINGTDNLFLYGMYSTFISSLNISILVFPSKELYSRWNLGFLSKAWVLITLVPVIWIIAKNYIAKYAELIILAVMTLIFFISHILLNAKYPSDRSVIYLLYLVYIPVILHLVQYKNVFFKLHYYSVLLFGLINFGGFIYEITKPTLYDVMKKQPVKSYTIVSDWPNLADTVYNDFYFDNRLRFIYIQKSYETDMDLIDRNIRAAVNNPQGDFLLIQKSNFSRNKALFDSSYEVRPVMSSNSKEFYLIRKKTE
jgi:hypothetical protein